MEARAVVASRSSLQSDGHIDSVPFKSRALSSKSGPCHSNGLWRLRECVTSQRASGEWLLSVTLASLVQRSQHQGRVTPPAADSSPRQCLWPVK